MSFEVCIDIGGTFTDCLVSDESGKLSIFKAATTPDSFHKGFLDVLGIAAEGLGLSGPEFIGRIGLLVHGSTVSTNALIERNVAATGLIVTKGHRDILLLREGPRKSAFDWRVDYPQPYIPRHRTRGIGGRIDARGRELIPLSEADVVAAVDDFKRMGIEAIAVGLLWSVVNTAHEQRVRELLNEHWPNVPVTLSSEINPIAREYRRIIAAAIDASVSPVIHRYVRELEAALAAAGFQGELLLANSVGGMMPPAEMLRRPIYSVMSGPTLAPVAALTLAEERDIVVGDMGGTTFDVSALRDRQLIVTTDSLIHDDFLGIAKVDVRSVGAGGGSIAWIDEGGLLHVGPRSAGARPGPACYGLGGTEATVTDANVVLGIIDPNYFLGGRLALNRAAADRALEALADAIDASLLETAYGVHTTSNHNMVAAIEQITIREGVDPRDSYFVCGGGATPCHIAEMADVLGLRAYMVPRFVAGLSAFGGLMSALRWEESRVLPTSTRDFAAAQVDRLLAELRQKGDDFLARAGIPPGRRRFEFFFLGRYEYQSWDIEVAFEVAGDRLSKMDMPRLIEAFHRMHERIYSVCAEGDIVEFTTWKVRAIGERNNTDNWRNQRVSAHRGPIVPKSERPLYQPALRRLIQTPVYEVGDLGAGATIEGPGLIESSTFTALLKEGHRATVDEWGNFRVVVH